MMVLLLTHEPETVFVVLDMQAHDVTNAPKDIMAIQTVHRVPVVFPEH